MTVRAVEKVAKRAANGRSATTASHCQFASRVHHSQIERLCIARMCGKLAHKKAVVVRPDSGRRRNRSGESGLDRERAHFACCGGDEMPSATSGRLEASVSTARRGAHTP